MLQIETIFKHLLGTVGKMFRRIATSFLITFLVAAGLTEGASIALNAKFPPPTLTHVVAAIIGFGWALVVSLAVAIEEGLRSFVVLIEEVGKATAKAAGALEHAAVREGEQLLQGAERAAQGLERGAATAVRDVVRLPGEIAHGVEHAVQGVEQRITGRTPSDQ
jgi:Zn-dependent alcohol dehydrogenase